MGLHGWYGCTELNPLNFEKNEEEDFQGFEVNMM